MWLIPMWWYLTTNDKKVLWLIPMRSIAVGCLFMSFQLAFSITVGSESVTTRVNSSRQSHQSKTVTTTNPSFWKPSGRHYQQVCWPTFYPASSNHLSFFNPLLAAFLTTRLTVIYHYASTTRCDIVTGKGFLLTSTWVRPSIPALALR